MNHSRVRGQVQAFVHVPSLIPAVIPVKSVGFNSAVANLFGCNACRALVARSVFGWMYWLQKSSHLSQGMSYDLQAHAAGNFEG